jgi:peptidyl-prolyl cis-trans isomerase C
VQSRTAYIAKPTKDEMDDFYRKHPERFSDRKVINVTELTISSQQVTDELKQIVDSAKSLDDVGAWLDGQRILYTQASLVRSTADMPTALAVRLQDMKKGQMFLLRDGEQASVMALVDIHDSPVSIEAAAPQIERILIEQKSRELAAADLAHLRTVAKVEYLNETGSRHAGARLAKAEVKSADVPKDTSVQPGISQLR